jgi:hypothetical protein
MAQMEGSSQNPRAGGDPTATKAADRGTRSLRISMAALIVFGLEWRFAEPSAVVTDGARFAIPWAMAALLPVFALAAWAYEATGRGGLDFKTDLVWGVLIATVAYLAATAFVVLA